MTFRLWIDTGNDTFGEFQQLELARLLREAADRITNGEDISQYKNLLDTNGNVCGGFALKERHDEP